MKVNIANGRWGQIIILQHTLCFQKQITALLNMVRTGRGRGGGGGKK